MKAKIAGIEKNTDYWADKANWIKPNKPVAELVLEQMAVGDSSNLRVNWLTDSYPPVGTKLYTHPVKELTLTNEKILEVIKELEDSIYFDESLGFFELKEFAEAILRKAQEK